MTPRSQPNLDPWSYVAALIEAGLVVDEPRTLN